jgi:hypothetical protein
MGNNRQPSVFKQRQSKLQSRYSYTSIYRLTWGMDVDWF